MNQNDIILIRESFAKVEPISEQAASIFYGRLFAIAPETQKLFKGDMREQGRKLMSTIGLVVASLDRLDTILPAVKNLGVRHVGYGVKSDQYDDVGEALLWTLKQGLGDDFTPAHHDAWAHAYGTVSQVMITAAEESCAPVKAR